MTRRGLHMTPELLESSYTRLCTTPPFCRWGMPDPDHIDFKVMVTRERFGHHRAYARDKTRCEIAVSTMVDSLCLLDRVMAHEMCHHRQEQLGDRSKHGPVFQQLVKLVCRHHGFDYAQF